MSTKIETLLGNTPIVKLEKLFLHNVYAKIEYYNPTFSIKDRIAFNIIKKAYDEGRIQEGDTVIEATSGNTGLGICFAAAVYNLHVICTVFDKVPIEKINLLKAFGAVVIICNSQYESNEEYGYVGVAKQLAQNLDNVFYIDQFNNVNNILTHYNTTGPEIWEQINGNIDLLFATIGTGGTISGIGKYLKEKNNKIKIIGVEPIGGIYKSYLHGRNKKYQEHLIQSISDDFISSNFKRDYVDDIIQVEDTKSFSMCYEIMRKEGLCVGTSSGCVLAAIREYCQNKNVDINANIITIFPDNGMKYIDTLFNETYLTQHKLLINYYDDERKQLINMLKNHFSNEQIQCNIF